MPEVATLEQAREVIKAQQAQLEEITQGGYQIGVVREVFDKSYVMQVGSDTLEMDRRPGKFQYKEGDVVCVVTMTKQIMRASQYQLIGTAGKITELHSRPGLSPMYEVSTEAANQQTLFIKATRVPKLELGDRVLIDQTGTVILQKLKSEQSQFLLTEKVNIGWADIGGLSHAKEELQMAIEMPLQHGPIFQAFNKKPPKGFLFHGRPGNGKTLLGKAVATSLAKIYGADESSGFIYVKGPEILVKWVGDTEANIRGIFEQARAHKRKHGYAAVIFIDEADAILGNRTRSISSSIGHTVVPQFLSEMDGMEDSGAIVLLATNRADVLDPAVVRPGRIDRKLYVNAPTAKDADDILQIHMRGLPASDEKAELKKQAIAQIYSDDYPVYQVKTQQGDKQFHLRELVSGAMLASVVEHATSCAIKRNIDGGRTKTVDGLRTDDFVHAVSRIHKQQAGLDHQLELKEFAEVNKLQVINTKPLLSLSVQ